MKRILLAGAACVAMTSVSMAADFSYGAPEAVDIWSGWYAGVQGGKILDTEVIFTGGFGGPDPMDGAFGGVYWGRNWQFGSLVLGLDGSIALADITYDPSTNLGVPYEVEIPAFSASRARLGYAFNNFLVFGAVGFSLARVEFDHNVQPDKKWFKGFTYGGGVEMKFADNWSGRVEYLHIDYGDEDVGTSPFNMDIGDFDIIRAGIAYHF